MKGLNTTETPGRGAQASCGGTHGCMVIVLAAAPMPIPGTAFVLPAQQGDAPVARDEALA
ncbi:hypothetical protein [Burkholderia metallica]|uniref:hypothetical protein n=1 Tax=Burkholderia metallica TaxID=488729 RepID=UPI00158D412E|nr:hypothetical protein [Burkholderia metallica]MCA8017296.1 hypothetical protein [Burkholderia metallica]